MLVQSTLILGNIHWLGRFTLWTNIHKKSPFEIQFKRGFFILKLIVISFSSKTLSKLSLLHFLICFKMGLRFCSRLHNNIIMKMDVGVKEVISNHLTLINPQILKSSRLSLSLLINQTNQ